MDWEDGNRNGLVNLPVPNPEELICGPPELLSSDKKDMMVNTYQSCPNARALATLEMSASVTGHFSLPAKGSPLVIFEAFSPLTMLGVLSTSTLEFFSIP